MIRIAEQDLRAKFLERLLRQALYGSGCAHRHESRGLDGPVGSVQTAAARAFRGGFQQFEAKFIAASLAG